MNKEENDLYVMISAQSVKGGDFSVFVSRVLRQEEGEPTIQYLDKL